TSPAVFGRCAKTRWRRFESAVPRSPATDASSSTRPPSSMTARSAIRSMVSPPKRKFEFRDPLTPTRRSTILARMGRCGDARDRLLDATIELIWRESYGAVTVDSICAKAGVKKGSFYYFFESKDELVGAALEAHWKSIQPELDRLFSPSVPP